MADEPKTPKVPKIPSLPPSMMQAVGRALEKTEQTNRIGGAALIGRIAADHLAVQQSVDELNRGLAQAQARKARVPIETRDALLAQNGLIAELNNQIADLRRESAERDKASARRDLDMGQMTLAILAGTAILVLLALFK